VCVCVCVYMFVTVCVCVCARVCLFASVCERGSGSVGASLQVFSLSKRSLS
jgi:hypothetical protein